MYSFVEICLCTGRLRLDTSSAGINSLRATCHKHEPLLLTMPWIVIDAMVETVRSTYFGHCQVDNFLQWRNY